MVNAPLAPDSNPSLEMSRRDRYVILLAAFLGWMFAGMEMAIFPLAARPATIDLLGRVSEGQLAKWFAWYTCAFLMGAAVGGLAFGWLGDRAGRVKAMAASIIWYSSLTGVSYFSQTAEQLLILRFLASMGIGGMWPSGVSLTSEAWPDVSRPMLAGLIGTAANVGIVLMGVIGFQVAIEPTHWRWVLLVGGMPIFLGFFVLACVRESPEWLLERNRQKTFGSHTPIAEVFKPPLLRLTLLGICLGAIPLLGGWGSANWLIPWAGQVYEKTDPNFKGLTVICRSSGAVLGSLLGGWLASQFGRRSTYFVISLGSLLTSGYLFRNLTPESSLSPATAQLISDYLPWISADKPGLLFLVWAFLLGFVATIYFGWLPLYLPELFPTRARATGSGVTFNFGRIVATAGVLGAGALMVHYKGDYAKVGTITSLIYALGMVVILFAPDTSQKRLHLALEPAEA